MLPPIIHRPESEQAELIPRHKTSSRRITICCAWWCELHLKLRAVSVIPLQTRPPSSCFKDTTGPFRKTWALHVLICYSPSSVTRNKVYISRPSALLAIYIRREKCSKKDGGERDFTSCPGVQFLLWMLETTNRQLLLEKPQAQKEERGQSQCRQIPCYFALTITNQSKYHGKLELQGRILISTVPGMDSPTS